MALIPFGQKIFTTAPEVNTTYSGPASLQALNAWYTMQDISDTVRPYKVFVGLATQSGGDDQLILENEPLVIGVTYTIDDPTGGDFTNVGAPDNNQGTSFIAIGTTPNNWGTATLLYNTGAPVVKVLENTIGNIWFDYTTFGDYTARSLDLFIDEKTVVFFGPPRTAEDPLTIGVEYDASRIPIKTALDLVLSDDLLRNTPIEIRVYN